MTTDRYTRTVLTVIAIALSVIAVRMSFSDTARATGNGCGSISEPCYVQESGGFNVNVTSWPSGGAFPIDGQ